MSAEAPSAHTGSPRLLRFWLAGWLASVPYQVAAILSIAIPSASGLFFNIHASYAALIFLSQLAAYSQLLFFLLLVTPHARGNADRGSRALALGLAGFCSVIVLAFTVLQRIRVA